MRKFYFVLILIAGFLACSKKNNVDNNIPRDIPAWLQARIEKMVKEENKKLFTVTGYKIDGVGYFNISMAHQSCMLCDIYDEKGNSASIVIEKNTQIEKVRTIWPVIQE
ncbi:hypothetical protein [Niabella aquatica]